MYLEHEELLKLVNTLEKERDEARTDAIRMATRARQYRILNLMYQADDDLLEHKRAQDAVIREAEDVLRRYTI